MSWIFIADSKMIDTLNHLHSEVVFNAVTNIAQRPDLTVAELRELLDIIEGEVVALREHSSREKHGRLSNQAES